MSLNNSVPTVCQDFLYVFYIFNCASNQTGLFTHTHILMHYVYIKYTLKMLAYSRYWIVYNISTGLMHNRHIRVRLHWISSTNISVLFENYLLEQAFFSFLSSPVILIKTKISVCILTTNCICLICVKFVTHKY